MGDTARFQFSETGRLGAHGGGLLCVQFSLTDRFHPGDTSRFLFGKAALFCGRVGKAGRFDEAREALFFGEP